MVKNRKWHSQLLAAILTFCAGFTDAYTFIERGGTLVAGQTGNVVFLSVSVVHDYLEDVEVKFVTLLAFILGIFLLTLYKHRLKRERHRLMILLPFILAAVWAGFQDKETWNMLIVPPLAFGMGLVTTAFTEVDGRFYNNAFMTGNLKRMMMAWGNYARMRERSHLEEALFLLRLVLSFIIGALLSASLTTLLGLQTIWVMAALLLIVLIGEYRMQSKAG